MNQYQIYLEFRSYHKNRWWNWILGKYVPPHLTFDPMITLIDHRSIVWAYPDLNQFESPWESYNSISWIHHWEISSYDNNIYEDAIKIYEKESGKFSNGLDNPDFASIRKTLQIKNEPMLYQMADFHHPEEKSVYFIGTFRLLNSKKSITTVLSYDIDKKSISINEKFGDQGKIFEFKVHVDSPPIVDQTINCAIVLSFAEPRILVICLKTFVHVIVDLSGWTTEGFIERWERDKRRICMIFLSNYEKLMFFPRYTSLNAPRFRYAGPKVPYLSTLVNWKRMRDDYILPKLQRKRKEQW